jgi:hypothetical protein
MNLIKKLLLYIGIDIVSMEQEIPCLQSVVSRYEAEAFAKQQAENEKHKQISSKRSEAQKAAWVRRKAQGKLAL